uniref:Thioredoxin domain-containing protein n=1 Tax=Setaria digitata TaxID=48799 RepID=A0A915PSC3_9BILA
MLTSSRRHLQLYRMHKLFLERFARASGVQHSSSSPICMVKVPLQNLRTNQLFLKNFVFCRKFCSEESLAVIFDIEGEEDFTDKVLKSSVPVLVDFYADWCGPCKMLGPRIEAKVMGREGNVRLARVNVDYATDVAMDYDVNAVPTVMAVKFGQIVGRLEGLKTDDELDDFIDSLIHSE